MITANQANEQFLKNKLLSESFNESDKSHDINEIYEIINDLSLRGKSYVGALRLTYYQIEELKENGFKISFETVQSPISKGEEIVIGHKISWNEID